MRTTRIALGTAGAGVLAGVVGLALLAAPAGAGPAPSLPTISPEALVQSVLSAEPTPLSGIVTVDNALGLPAVPGVPALTAGTTDIQVATDGKHKARISMADPDNTMATETVVSDGSSVWLYDSTDKSVTHYRLPASADRAPDKASLNPAALAKRLVSEMRDSSTVSVNGTAEVAGRDVYRLVLTPKPSEKTLLRKVTVAVDAQRRMPLELDVYGNNTPDPALRVGFTSLQVGPQDPATFRFTPPAGATVTEKSTPSPRQAERMAESLPMHVVGDGWDTVVVGRVPAKTLAGQAMSRQGGGEIGSDPGEVSNPQQLLSRFGQRVSGSWGHGWIVRTTVGTALVTSDGQVAAGFVPQQVLTAAIGTK